MRIPKGVTPECFNRGSTMLTTTLSHVEWVGGPVRVRLWRAQSSHRQKHAGMTDSGEPNNRLYAASCEESNPQ